MMVAEDRLLSAFVFCIVICFFTIVVGKLNLQEMPNIHHVYFLFKEYHELELIQCNCLHI